MCVVAFVRRKTQKGLQAVNTRNNKTFKRTYALNPLTKELYLTKKNTALKPTDAGQPTLGTKKKYKFPEL